MKCKICDGYIKTNNVHKEDIEHLIKDEICWLCRAKGLHVVHKEIHET